MSHAKTKVAVSVVIKTEHTNRLFPEISESVKKVGRRIQLSPFTHFSLSLSVILCISFCVSVPPPLSLSLSLSLSLRLSYDSHLLRFCCICLSKSTYSKTFFKKNILIIVRYYVYCISFLDWHLKSFQ